MSKRSHPSTTDTCGLGLMPGKAIDLMDRLIYPDGTASRFESFLLYS